MTIFAILLPNPQPPLVEAIKAAYPNDYLSITDTQWLISASGTVVEVTAKIKIYDAKTPNSVGVGSAIVFATSSYFGRAPATIWEWIKTKLESSPSG
jgi:hypothetical protein